MLVGTERLAARARPHRIERWEPADLYVALVADGDTVVCIGMMSGSRMAPTNGCPLRTGPRRRATSTY